LAAGPLTAKIFNKLLEMGYIDKKYEITSLADTEAAQKKKN